VGGGAAERPHGPFGANPSQTITIIPLFSILRFGKHLTCTVFVMVPSYESKAKLDGILLELKMLLEEQLN